MKAKSPSLPEAENLREKLLTDQRTIHVTDLGTKPSGNRPIADIARTSLSPAKFSKLYQRIISYYNLPHVLELGTSLGINTLYLASGNTKQVLTFEGSHEIASIAELTFDFAGVKNITLVKGDIHQTLSPALQHMRKVDFALIDANHTYEATIHFFKLLLTRLHEKSVVVIDDIHHNSGMEKAWDEIKASKLVHSSADLYRAGILFFDPSLNKQHVILQF